MVLKIAIFQKNDRNLIGKIMHCALGGFIAGIEEPNFLYNPSLIFLFQAPQVYQKWPKIVKKKTPKPP